MTKLSSTETHTSSKNQRIQIYNLNENLPSSKLFDTLTVTLSVIEMCYFLAKIWQTAIFLNQQ